MSYIFNIILNFIDFFYQKKIINFFKKNIDQDIELLLDVGSHKGETIKTFVKNFNIYSYISKKKEKIKKEKIYIFIYNFINFIF